MGSIDEILSGMHKVQQNKLRRRILALIAEEEAKARADWSGITKLKDARRRRRDGKPFGA